jgi:hypothetical protein
MLHPEKIFELIAPYSQRIRGCITKAVQHYQVKLSEESAIIDQRCISSYIRCHIIANLEEEFKNEPGVYIEKKQRMRGMVVLVILKEPIILLRFKKFNHKNEIACAKTQQSLKFSYQQLTLFPEYCETLNLNAGYKWLNDLHTQIDCLIGLPNGLRKHSWVEPIPGKNTDEIISETPTTKTKNEPKLIKETINNEKIG